MTSLFRFKRQVHSFKKKDNSSKFNGTRPKQDTLACDTYLKVKYSTNNQKSLLV